MKKVTFVLINILNILIVIVAYIYIAKDPFKDPVGDNCEYRCDNGPHEQQYCPRQECKPAKKHKREASKEDRPKRLFATEKDAICAADYDTRNRDFKNGFRVYECPGGHGFHLSTQLGQWPLNEELKKGIIINLKGRDVGKNICR